jgi:CspA family cold shock protein
MMPIGTVKFFNDSKGFGFIAPEAGGDDAFVHVTALQGSGLETLRENERVSYDLEPDRRGRMSAANVKPADEAPPGEG